METIAERSLGVLPSRSSENSATLINQHLREILLKENRALELIATALPTNAHLLVETMLSTAGRVVFSGTGKSGIVGKKLVATCSSLGIPSFFLHPHEALHGDLGMVMPGDLFIALSKSATGSELSIIVAALKLMNVTTALIACGTGTLTREVDIPITLPFEQEACPLNLAPTSSSTVTMAFGDALALVVSSLKNFTRNDFARFHPAGALGKKLLLQADHLMYKAPNLPILQPDDTFKNFIVIISEKKMGIGIVVNQQQELIGIITDGDLRRACAQGPDVFNATALSVMTKSPKTITKTELACAALGIMESFNITSLVVTDNNKPIGLLHIHEIIKAGIKNS